MQRSGSWLPALMMLALSSLGCDESSTGLQPSSKAWQKFAGNPVVSPGPAGSWDEFGVGSPVVIQLAPDEYKMWFTGHDSLVSHIGLALSTDGILWTKSSTNPVLSPGAIGSWEGLGVRHPVVLYHDGLYRMYYAGVGDGTTGIGLAFSTDGIHWSRSESNPVLSPSEHGAGWDNEQVYTPWVLLDGGSFQMWYGAVGHKVYSAVGYATSRDGITWQRSLDPVLHPQVLESLTFSPCVRRTGTSYRMWYGAYHESPAGGIQPGTIDYAQSQDGANWSWHRTIMSPGQAGAWDANNLKSACVLDEAGTTRMWYEGDHLEARGDSSLAVSSIGLAVFQ